MIKWTWIDQGGSVTKKHVTKYCDQSKGLDNFSPRDTPLGDAPFHLYINKISPAIKITTFILSNSLPLICNGGHEHLGKSAPQRSVGGSCPMSCILVAGGGSSQGTDVEWD
jgi:hypothetical protein